MTRLACDQGHSFDIARQGYVNLSGRATPAHADTAAMITARRRFLEGGHFAMIVDVVTELAPESGLIVDAGAGPGWYSAALLDRRPGLAGLALDISPAAAKIAARAHPRLAAAVIDIWQELPLRTGVADLVLNIFAPRNTAQFARILRPGGLLMVVTPGPGHLQELRDSYGLLGIEAEKSVRLARTLAENFEVLEERTLRRDLALTGEQVADVVNMGPNAHHTAIAHADRATVSADLRITVARSAGDSAAAGGR